MDLLVDRTDIARPEIVETPDARELKSGEARLQIENFALTANNITYAAAGDFLKYWSFFPAPEGMGRVPVWGFAKVVETKADGVEVGARYYGYFPMSTELIVAPVGLNEHGFSDGAAHRQKLAAVYNRYLRTDTDPVYDPATEDYQMIFRPLFGTAFLIDDFLAEEKFFGADQVIFSSASSKTAYSTAFLVSQRPEIRLVGLTSSANRAFVEDLGIYDQVVSYEDIASLDAATSSVFVDMAGNANIRAGVHRHFDECLKYSCSVGLSHWDQMRPQEEALPGPQPTMFFAPDQSAKRTKELGMAEFQKRSGHAWRQFLERAKSWVNIQHFDTAEALKENYLAFINGTAPADAGFIHRL